MAQKKKVQSPLTRSAAPLTEGTTLLDVEALRQVVEILEASDVTRLLWRRGPERLFIRRGQQSTTTIVHAAAPGPGVSPVPVEYAAPPPRAAGPEASAKGPEAGAAPAVEKKGQVLTSPFVGTFYRTPAPDQPPFVEVGLVVRKGQVLCIVEAMKLMNEIEAESAGKVTEILVENGTPVEFGQALFRIEPV
ncbi:MAG: acetyl-CoA carboxylase biotin carboxyl carrier protein [Myxococcaceae bacterium]